MKPLFPYFGGKRRAAIDVWDALGEVDRYIEPFFGSGAVLLSNPVTSRSELVNDLDHHVVNLWRSLQTDPENVWRVASVPCAEIELRARVKWLKSWKAPDFSDLSACDPYAAGVWLWASCAGIKIGSRDLHRSTHGQGIHTSEFTKDDYHGVVERMRRVQVLCGDWKRCVTPAALNSGVGGCKMVGVFLDPPYGEGNGVGYETGDKSISDSVWNWAVENGDNPKMRIVVAGYEDGRVVPDSWTTIERKESGGFANRGENENRHRERLWLSPHCIRPETPSLFF